jgi:hypothetical protein
VGPIIYSGKYLFNKSKFLLDSSYYSSGLRVFRGKFLNRHSVKAHEVRALASSWALFNSASISKVLSAGFWRCQDSFTSFYLEKFLIL